MRKFKYILLLVFVGLIAFNACKKDDSYNWEKYKPSFLGTINGPTTVSASGNAAYPSSYEVSYYRGGSTFEWTVTTKLGTGTATVTTSDVNDCKAKKADIVFPQRAAVDTAFVSVVEVSNLGVKSDPKVQKVVLKPFCALTIDDFVGTFSAVEKRPNKPDANTTVEIVKEDATTLRVKAQAGKPGFLASVFNGWGETFITGHGLDGDILIHVNLNTGALTFTKGEYWGRTDYDYDYWYTGSGTWSGCTMTMNVSFALHYDQNNFDDAGDYPCTVAIDLNSKK